MPETPKTTPKTEPAQPGVTPAKPGDAPSAQSKPVAKEHGGPKGPEPTRYGDWEKNGRCIDF